MSFSHRWSYSYCTHVILYRFTYSTNLLVSVTPIDKPINCQGIYTKNLIVTRNGIHVISLLWQMHRTNQDIYMRKDKWGFDWAFYRGKDSDSYAQNNYLLTLSFFNHCLHIQYSSTMSILPIMDLAYTYSFSGWSQVIPTKLLSPFPEINKLNSFFVTKGWNVRNLYSQKIPVAYRLWQDCWKGQKVQSLHSAWPYNMKQQQEPCSCIYTFPLVKV